MAQKFALAVDDEPDLLEAYNDILSSLENVKVLTASDGMDAYRKARNQKFDIIITDYQMPKLNGVQMIKALRENYVNDQTPIIVISAYPEKVIRDLKEEKLDRNVTILSKPFDFDTVANLAKTLMIEVPKKDRKGLDVDFINPFLISVQSTIKQMGMITNVTPGKAEIFTSGATLKTDISSYLSVVSTHFNGTLVLAFPKETYLQLASNALGEKFSEIDDTNKDFAGELNNIMFGSTKKLWNDKGYSVEKAIPHVQVGIPYSTPVGHNLPSIVIPFESDAGPFYAVISIVWG